MLVAGSIAFLNGEWIPARQAVVPVTDQGFVQGVTVAEQLRTFSGKLFRLEQHLDRLYRSLAIIGVDPGITREQLQAVAQELVRRNWNTAVDGGDLALAMFVTPGVYGAFAAADYVEHIGPNVGIHTYPLPFVQWAEKYRSGESLWVTSITQVPATCWPPELKCRSRMHYFLADKEARQRESGARALMTDAEGFVTESSTANLLIYREGEGLVSPPEEKILPGVTVAALRELADKLGLSFRFADLRVNDVATANEVLLCSTSPCVWSVTRLNGQPIGDGTPGPVVAKLQKAWSDMVGVDIVAQAQRCAKK
jgi:branched-subunit amino acid aminotransferase/4-amino-4-deoxychorismate lyase